MIPVYAAERQAGLEEAIRSTASLVYASQVELANRFHLAEQTVSRLKHYASKASQDDFDLHYLKTILATVGWNKNDDVFDRTETWLARHTPEDKPFNYEHNCSDIIGHITGSYVIGDDDTEVPEDTLIDNLPAKYHVVTSAVLYKFWAKKELQERMDRVLAEIADGQWYVSMEALFKNFDYAMIGQDGTGKVVARNQDTAFLTKHMRAYGGDGSYGDYKVGRLLRNFTFSGKGLVRKPANPESIIFSESETFQESNAAIPEGLGYSAMTHHTELDQTMATELDLQKQLAEAKLEIERLQAALKDNDVKALKAELETAKAEKKKFADALEDAKKKHAEMSDAHEKAKKHGEDLKAHIDEMEKGHKAKMDEVMNAAKASQDELATLKAAKKTADRVLAVAEKLKFDGEKATALVEKFKALDDEQFDAVVETIKASQDMMTQKPATNNPASGNTTFPHGEAKTPPKATNAKDPPKATDKPAPMQAKSGDNADTQNLDTATPDQEPALSTATEEAGVKTLRMEIAKHFGYQEEK